MTAAVTPQTTPAATAVPQQPASEGENDTMFIAVPVYMIYKNISRDQITNLINSSLIIDDKQAALGELAQTEKQEDLDLLFNKLIVAETYALEQSILLYDTTNVEEADKEAKAADRANLQSRYDLLMKIKQNLTPKA